MRVDRLTATAEMQHARARDGHLRHSITGYAFQETKILQHRMVAKAQFAGHLDAAGLGLHSVKLNALLHVVAFYTIEPLKEVEVPPGTTELTIGHDL
ncbi:hypothetical protein D3C78_1723020 [compost metagenome]